MEWRSINGFEGLYEVSNTGLVRRVPSTVEQKNGVTKTVGGRELKLHKDTNGYVSVMLSKNGVHSRKSVHRLVANAFVPNHNGLPEVNHIDEDRTNNNAYNLEWCDRHRNMCHGTRRWKFSASKGSKVGQYVGDTLIATYISQSVAAELLGLKQAGISSCVRGEIKTYGGYIWKHAE